MDHKIVVSTDLEWVGNIINGDSHISMWELVVLLLFERDLHETVRSKVCKIVNSWDCWGLYELCCG